MVACVASVSVLFPSKDRAKMARVSGEGVGKKGENACRQIPGF